jgi:hypothetical protein
MDCADWYAWVRSVDFAMSETGALYTQWPTFRCFGAIDALGPKSDMDRGSYRPNSWPDDVLWFRRPKTRY